VGTDVGTTDGAPVTATVGSAVGLRLGGVVGGIDGSPGPVVGITVGSADGADGTGVGAYVTSCTPAPDTTVVPEHNVMPSQPSWIRYVSVAVLAGTVYCTCAHTLPPDVHAAGGRPPVPVSSYTTSTPVAE
jgi:hypothetical protein